MAKGRQWIVKYAKRIETVDGLKILCPYCDMLHDQDKVKVNDVAGTCPSCHTPFCFKPEE